MSNPVQFSGTGDGPAFEEISDGGKILAIIVRSTFSEPGIRFFSQPDFSQQFGYMRRPAGYAIAPHVHNPVQREVVLTQEVLFVRSGLVRVDLFRDDHTLLTSRLLSRGDTVFLAEGGHGLEMVEDSEILEVKQGPYAGDGDKTRFEVRHT